MYVTPCTGVWIEITVDLPQLGTSSVTPCTGVWIEIVVLSVVEVVLLSLPARECGLKLHWSPLI